MNTEGFALDLVVEKPHVSSTCSFFELVDMEVWLEWIQEIIESKEMEIVSVTMFT